jgi:hypothetical protein
VLFCCGRGFVNPYDSADFSIVSHFDFSRISKLRFTDPYDVFL